MPDKPAPAAAKRPTRMGALGGQLVMCVLVGGALGYSADVLFGWPHWGLIAGIVLGFCAWGWEMWKMIR